MRNRGAGNQDSDAILDRDEQEKIVKDLQKEATAQASSTRMIFGWIFVLFATVSVGLAVHFVMYPWSLPHEGQLSGSVVPFVAFPVHYLALALCNIIGFSLVRNVNMFGGIERAIGGAMALFALLFWTVTLYHTDYLHSPAHVVLLPLGPSLLVMLGDYIDREQRTLLAEAESLESAIYDFKKI